MKFAWIDVRQGTDKTAAIVEESIHAGVEGIVSDDPSLLATLPPNVRKIVVLRPGMAPSLADELVKAADLVFADHGLEDADALLPQGTEPGVHINIVDESSLETACKLATRVPWMIAWFQQDPSKIPLEILLAAADKAAVQLVTVVHDLEDAEVTLGVLERGSEGVLLAPREVGDATALVRICKGRRTQLELEEMEIVKLTHIGLGERVCVDTTSHFGRDEGILVGSFARGMLLISAETHPLPYMATRPFRVNAAALHSYTLTPDNRTRYLAELGGGSDLLAVNVKGEARRIAVGRIKMETRPLLRIQARSASGTDIDLVMQDDWHVRLLGPGGSVHNATELKPGDKVLGYALSDQRHVGYPIKEFLHEQ
ncbi:3-dehydroquinate synthase II family protein [Streptomyces abikoensis]